MCGFGVWAQHETSDTRSISKLRAVGPFLHQRRRDVVVPATPIVPGDEDDGVRPEATLDHGIHLVCGPFLAGLDRLDRVLAQAGRAVDPGHRRQLAGRGIFGEAIGGDVVLAAFERGDVAVGVTAVITPAEPGLLECGGQGWDVERRLVLDRVAVMRIVDDRRVRGDQHQVIWRRWTGDLREVPVAQRVSLRITPIVGDIRSDTRCADRKSTRLNSSHVSISYAVFCLKKKKKKIFNTNYSPTISYLTTYNQI